MESKLHRRIGTAKSMGDHKSFCLLLPLTHNCNTYRKYCITNFLACKERNCMARRLGRAGNN